MFESWLNFGGVGEESVGFLGELDSGGETFGEEVVFEEGHHDFSHEPRRLNRNARVIVVDGGRHVFEDLAVTPVAEKADRHFGEAFGFNDDLVEGFKTELPP